MKILKTLFILFLLLFFGCSLEEPSKTITSFTAGNADFSSFVSLGNSLTAGYQSGALTSRHQAYSYPNLIAQQANVDNFAQPLLGYPGIGAYSASPTSPAGIVELTFIDNPATPNTVNPDPVLTPQLFADYPSFNPMMPWESSSIRDYPAPYNN